MTPLCPVDTMRLARQRFFCWTVGCWLMLTDHLGYPGPDAKPALQTRSPLSALGPVNWRSRAKYCTWGTPTAASLRAGTGTTAGDGSQAA